MRANPKCTSKSPSQPPNAFTREFLAKLRRLDDPPSARESSLRGPWEVEELRAMESRLFGVTRRDEPFREGGGLLGVFPTRAEALQLAAALPAIGAPVALHLNRCGRRRGYALHDGQDFLGHVARDDAALAPTLHVVRRLRADPDALALLLEAAGPEALKILGRAIQRRIDRLAG